ncbi:MAG: hypothetical protein KAQ71_19590, partial [Desulfobulbaceae bacterium]|nr:hypothetical protein [Desulfobulbaceae bacterium]
MLNQELETGKTDLMDLVAREAQYKNIYQNATSNKESLKKRLKIINKEESVTNHRVAELREKKSKAQEKLDSYRKEIGDLKKHINII